MPNRLRVSFVLVFALLLVACGGAPANGFSRPLRGGGPVQFDRQPILPAKWQVRSNLHIQLHVRQDGRVETVGVGVDRLYDVASIGSELEGSPRAKVDIRSWNDTSSKPGATPQAGRSYIVSRIGPELRIEPIGGRPMSPGERAELEKLHGNFGKPSDTELALAGRSLSPGDTVPFVQNQNGTVVEGQIRLLGVTQFQSRPVAEFEFVGVASQVSRGFSVRADLRGVLLVDPPSSQTLMMDVEGPARAYGGAIEATGRSHAIATSTPL